LVQADAFYRMFRLLAAEPDLEYTMIDGTIIKVHRSGQGAKGGHSARRLVAIMEGITTKILALTDALGNLVDFCLMPGQAHDLRETRSLLQNLLAEPTKCCAVHE
jgi:hypothetical protein